MNSLSAVHASVNKYTYVVHKNYSYSASEHTSVIVYMLILLVLSVLWCTGMSAVQINIVVHGTYTVLVVIEYTLICNCAYIRQCCISKIVILGGGEGMQKLNILVYLRDFKKG